MHQPRLTRARRSAPKGQSIQRRRTIAALFGLLALVLQSGFTLGAAAGLAAAPAHSLSAALAQLCLGGPVDPESDFDTAQSAALDCSYCRVCSAAAALAPNGETVSPPNLRDSAQSARPSADFADSDSGTHHQPRAPPA